MSAIRTVFTLACLALLCAACAPVPAPSTPVSAGPTNVPATVKPDSTLLPPTEEVATPSTGQSPLPTPTEVPAFDSPLPSPPPDAGGVLTPGQVLANPEQYVGQEITVEGILKAEGRLPAVRFYLEGQDGARLEVTSWLPLEVMQPAQGGKAPPSMATVADHTLRVTGTLEKGGDGLILKAVSAETLQ